MRRRFALLVLLGASVALLFAAPAAGAEVSGGLAPTSSATADAAALAEQPVETAASAAPIEPVEAPTTPPVEAPEAESSTDSTRATVAAAGDRRVSTPSADAGRRSVATVVDSVTTRTGSIARAGTAARDATISAAKTRVQATVGSVAHDSSAAIGSVVHGTTETVSPLTERRTTGTAGSSPASLRGPLSPAGMEALPPLPVSSQTGSKTPTPTDGALGFPELQTGFSSPLSPTANRARPATSGGRAQIAGPALKGPHALGTTPPATLGATTGGHSGQAGPPGPAPLDGPPRAPAPEAVASASANSLFTPFVALLVLLALAAPTSLRRLREAAAVRAPTPFVCALERPG
jgi:hypothetical protein